MISQYID